MKTYTLASSFGQELADKLASDKLPALVSGLDVLGAFQNQLLSRIPSLVMAAPGAGDEVALAAERVGAISAVNPKREVIKALSSADSPVVFVRELSLADYPDIDASGHARRAEDAWIDLVAEARRGYPVAPGELAIILAGLQQSGISWGRLHRAASRKGWPIRLDADHVPPIEFDSRDRFWRELNEEIHSAL